MTKEKSKLPSSTAAEVVKIGQEMAEWLKNPANSTAAEVFANSLIQQLSRCVPAAESVGAALNQRRREEMWTRYHQLRCSKEYTAVWQTFLEIQLNISNAHPVFWQSVGDGILAQVIKKQFSLPQQARAGNSSPQSLAISNRETNALRYAAGYVPRAVAKKLSKHPENAVNIRLQKCLQDLLQDSSSKQESEEWLDLVDRGGLWRVNETTFMLFQAMEVEVRLHVQIHDAAAANFKDAATKRVCDSEWHNIDL